jgi:hypothetical protein
LRLPGGGKEMAIGVPLLPSDARRRGVVARIEDFTVEVQADASRGRWPSRQFAT